MRIDDKAIEIYQGTFLSVYKYAQILSENDNKSISNFISKHPSGDSLWLRDFIHFSFEYYTGLDTHNNIRPNWIFGDKSWVRWEGRRDNWHYWVEKFRKKYNIESPEIVTEGIGVDCFVQFRENEKRRFLNTDRGFLHCKEMGIRKIEEGACLECKFKTDC